MAMNAEGNRLSSWIALTIFLAGIFLIMVGYKPTELPRPWFDEGWTLSTAKNWAESGAYALRLQNKWISPQAMAQPFTVTMPVAFSLRIFGMGILQARLPGILFSIGTLALLFLLAQQIYNTKIAWGALFTVLVFAAAPELQPIIFGRQALGEMPMLFYLLAGYWFWKLALAQPKKYIVYAIIFWGLGVATKRQSLPFWAISWIVPSIIALWDREWQVFKTTLTSGILAGLAALSLSQIDTLITNAWPLYGASIVKDLYAMAVWVWEKDIRLTALIVMVKYGLPALTGLLYAFYLLFKEFSQRNNHPHEKWLELSLFIFASSWMAWFILGSLGWPRYFEPVFIVTAIFVAKLLHDCSNGYSGIYTVTAIYSNIQRLRLNKAALGAMLSISIIIFGLFTGYSSWKHILESTDDEVYQIAEYLNHNTPENALIETYDSELFFLLDRPYHYPPPEVQVQLNRRMFLRSDAPVDYRPMDADPDYIVVGPFSRDWGLYKQLVNGNKFKLVKKLSNYIIYEQVR